MHVSFEIPLSFAQILIRFWFLTEFEAKNKTLVTENEGLKQTVRENGKTIFDMQVAIKEKSKQIENLENELREGEDMRHTILSLMQNKRKKWNGNPSLLNRNSESDWPAQKHWHYCFQTHPSFNKVQLRI